MKNMDFLYRTCARNDQSVYVCTNCLTEINFWSLAVIDGLDLLKKENSGARDAIRFLETEFRKGNRYVLSSAVSFSDTCIIKLFQTVEQEV